MLRTRGREMKENREKEKWKKVKKKIIVRSKRMKVKREHCDS